MTPLKNARKCKIIQQETHAVLNRQPDRQTSPKVATTWVTSISIIPDAVLSELTGIPFNWLGNVL